MAGICFHVGTQCLDLPVYGEAILAARKLFDVAKNIGYDFDLLDIGGGFPGENFANINEVLNHSKRDTFCSKLHYKITSSPVCSNHKSSD